MLDVWLILPFRIGSNLFKFLCIEVIFKYDIIFCSSLIIGIFVLFLTLDLKS